MGNAVPSCGPLIKGSKVLSPDGTMEFYTRAVKAGELMLEYPGNFVCEWSSLRVGHRIHGLSADQQLHKRHLYLLLPMDLLYSVLTHEELTSFSTTNSTTLPTSTNSSSSSSSNNFGKMMSFPSLGEFCMFLNIMPSESNKLGITTTTTSISNCRHRSSLSSEPPPFSISISKQRYSWRPALETIPETPSSRH